MNRTTTMMIAALGTAALCACASMRGADRPEPIERLDERGASAQVLEVAAGSRLHFVNADTISHEIYSNDCAELSSTLLKAGDSFDTVVGPGPKLCHFQDLLAPLRPEYAGTVNVQDDARSANSRYQ